MKLSIETTFSPLSWHFTIILSFDVIIFAQELFITQKNRLVLRIVDQLMRLSHVECFPPRALKDHKEVAHAPTWERERDTSFKERSPQGDWDLGGGGGGDQEIFAQIASQTAAKQKTDSIAHSYYQINCSSIDLGGGEEGGWGRGRRDR